VLTKTQLIENVWEWHFDTGTNVVEVYVGRLRRKLEDGHAVKLIHNVWGVGYLIKAEEQDRPGSLSMSDPRAIELQ
jgi:DNA-binding response OmpR family regulator